MPKPILIFGLHAVKALIVQHPQRIIRLLLLKQRDDHTVQSLRTIASQHSIPIELCSRHELDIATAQKNHQGVAAYCIAGKNYGEEDLLPLIENNHPPLLLLILDGIQDPHNLGACLRSASAAGVHAVVAPRDRSVGLTSVACKVASGAAETVPFMQVTNLARTLQKLKEKNIWVIGATADAQQTIYQGNLQDSIAIVMGGEGQGLRRLTREKCDLLLKIPMQGMVSSLNVAVATGIFLFEAVRKRAHTDHTAFK